MSDSDSLGAWWDNIEFSSPAPGQVQQTHAAHVCEGQRCPLHNPSDHHMRDWVLIAAGRQYLVHGMTLTLSYRLCEHDLAHPDPDSVAYLLTLDRENLGGWATHLCDGCCHPEQERLLAA